MRKLLALIITLSLITGCGGNMGNPGINPSAGINLVPNNTWQPILSPTPDTPPPVPGTPPTAERQKPQYPIILSPSVTDRIGYAVASEGMFCIYSGEKYGFTNENGDEVSPFTYDYVYPFSDGVACVRLGEKYGFIDKNGNEAIPFNYDKAAPFSEGLAYFASDDKYGFMDRDGNVAFYLDCDSVSSFKEGLAYFSIDGKYGYIDETGKEAIKPIYDDAGYFQDGLAKVRIGFKLGIIDKSGKTIAPAYYDDISFDSGYIIVTSGGKYGCLDKNGNTMLNPIYNGISILPGKDAAIIYLGDESEIIDFKGNVKVRPKYDSISYYGGDAGDGMLTVRLNEKVGFLDLSDYQEAIPPVYDFASPFIRHHAVVSINNKYGVIDMEGNITIPIVYDYIEIFEIGKLALDQGGKYKLADADGKVINDTPYDNITEIGSCYMVNFDGGYGFLDENGTGVGAPIYSYIFTGEYNSVYNSDNCCVASSYNPHIQDSIIIAGPDRAADLSTLLLQNVITPRIRPFSQYEKSGSINIPMSDYNTMDISVLDGMNECWKELKLYDIDGSGKPVLYFYATSLKRQGPGILSYSGLYSVKDNRLNTIVTGYECGGTLGGNSVSFFKDADTSEMMIGTSNHYGGFGGFAGGCDVYSYQNGKANKITSYSWVSQKAGNYDENDLLKNADLFYDGNGNPYSEDNILQASSVAEYTIDDERVTAEAYNNVDKRYECLLNMRLWP